MFGVSLGIMDGAGGAAGGSYESIATVTATGGETTLSFTSIASTYKHLQIRGIARINSGSDSQQTVQMQFNSDTTTANYVVHQLNGNGTAVAAGALVSNGSLFAGFGVGSGGLASTFGATVCDIIDYASTTKNKTTRTFTGTDTNSTANYRIYLASGLYISTNAITSIQLNQPNGFTTGSTFSLYGIKGA